MTKPTTGQVFAQLKRFSPRSGDRVFDFDAPWEELTTLFVVDVGGVLRVAGFRNGQSIDRALAELARPAPMLFSYVLRGLRMSGDMRIAWKFAQRRLYERPLLWSELRTLAVDAHISIDLLEYVVRSGVAAGLLYYEKQKRGAGRLELSTLLRTGVGQSRFAATLSSELRAAHGRLEDLVQHGPTIGEHREVLLRALLSRHLPQRYHVATGFITGEARQLDIIVYDQHNYSPRFREGDLVVVDIEAIRAVVEVKTTLTGQKFEEALEHIAGAAGSRIRAMPIFKGIFAFQTRIRRPSLIYDKMKKYYNGAANTALGPVDRSLTHLYQAPDAIATLGQFCVTTVPDLTHGAFVSLQPFDNEIGEDPFTATFVSLLLGFLDGPPDSKLRKASSGVSLRRDSIPMGPLHESGWKVTAFAGRQPSDTEGLAQYLEHVEQWRSGECGWSDVLNVCKGASTNARDENKVPSNAG